MARIAYTATFPAAQSGAEVTANHPIYLDAETPRQVAHAELNESKSVTVYSDATLITLSCNGEDLDLTSGSPTGSGDEPATPGPSSRASAITEITASVTAAVAGDNSVMTFAGTIPDGFTNDGTDLVLPEGVWWVLAAVYPSDSGEAAKTFQAFIQDNGTGRSCNGHLANLDANSVFDQSCPQMLISSDGTASIMVEVNNYGASAHDFTADLTFLKIG